MLLMAFSVCYKGNNSSKNPIYNAKYFLFNCIILRIISHSNTLVSVIKLT